MSIPDPLEAKLELMGREQLKDILYKLSSRYDAVVELLKSVPRIFIHFSER